MDIFKHSLLQQCRRHLARVQTALDSGITLPLVRKETAFRDQHALEGHEVRLAEQQCSKLIDVELPPARLLIEWVVPALDIIVGPDGLQYRPTASWPQPAAYTHISSTSPDIASRRCLVDIFQKIF